MILGKRLLSLFAVIALAAIAAHDVSADVNREPELKGKMLGVFGLSAVRGKIFTWPAAEKPTAANPVTIGILGNFDNVGMNYLEQRLAGTGAVILRFGNLDAYRTCHILFVSKTANFDDALAQVKGSPVLVVSESPGLAKRGAAINLVYDEVTNTMRLEVNPAAARNAKVQIDSTFLRSPLVDIVN